MGGSGAYVVSLVWTVSILLAILAVFEYIYIDCRCVLTTYALCISSKLSAGANMKSGHQSAMSSISITFICIYLFLLVDPAHSDLMAHPPSDPFIYFQKQKPIVVMAYDR